MNYDLKHLYNRTCDALDVLDSQGIGKNIGINSLKELLSAELLQFCLAMAHEDKKLTDEEVKELAFYFFGTIPANVNIDDVRKIFSSNNVLDNIDVEQIPTIIKIAAELDNSLYNAGRVNDTDAQLSIIICNLFNHMGKEIIACDAEVTLEEVNRLSAAYRQNCQYIRTKLEMWSESLEQKFDNSFIEEVTKKSVDERKTDVEEKSLKELLTELKDLIGLQTVKSDVDSLINLLQIRKIREQRGMYVPPMSLHLVFSGNPGTGKTTVARLLSQIYHQLGVLSKGHLTEVDRSGLVGGYVGQTAIKVKEVVEKAKGGILFIDEAYSLTANKGENDYGYEAVDTLLKAMEDNRDDLIVIVAGYPELMKEFLRSNPGLQSRFNKFINFDDYSPQELMDIFLSMCKKSNLSLTDDAAVYAKQFFEKRYLTRSSNFANGRDVRNFFESTLVNQANRISKISDITDMQLSTLELADLENITL